MNINSSHVFIDIIKTIGEPPYEVCGKPIENKKWDDNSKRYTDELLGHTYEIIVPKLNKEKVEIKIPGLNQLSNAKDGESIYCVFDNLELHTYNDRTGKLKLVGTADAVKPVKDTKTLRINQNQDN